MSRFFVILFAAYVILGISPAFAEEADTAELSTSPAPSTKKERTPPKPAAPTKEELEKQAKLRELAQQRREDLNGSRWEVTVSSQDPKFKGGKDILTFQNNQIDSKDLSGRGFPTTNYTITPIGEEGESAFWETMKTGKEGVVFMRGEWKEDTMQGTVTEQLDKGKTTVQYYFSSSGKKKIPPTKEEKTEAPKAEAKTPAKALTSSEPSEQTPTATKTSTKKKSKNTTSKTY